MVEDKHNEIHEVHKKIDDYIVSNDAYHIKQGELRTKSDRMLIEMHQGMFGNPDTGEIGLIKQMAPVLEAWKSVKWVFGFILAIGTLVLMAKNIFFK